MKDISIKRFNNVLSIHIDNIDYEFKLDSSGCIRDMQDYEFIAILDEIFYELGIDFKEVASTNIDLEW